MSQSDGVLYFIIQEISCMSQEQQTIKWGDIIRIHGVSTIAGRECRGLIISKGFTDPNIYYQTYEQYSDVNFYRESLFQIMPKSNFDLHDQLLFDQSIKEEQRDALKTRAEEEVIQLKSNLQNKYTDKEHPEEVNVIFGSEVVFRHVESGQYLCGVYKAADIRQGAFKLQLTKDLSSQIIFKVISHRSYQRQGNKIYYDDCLRIYHMKTDCYMNFPYADNIEDIAIILDKDYEVATFSEEDKGYQFAQSRPNIKKPKPKVGKRINVINENKPKCLWKFIQHCRYQDSLKKEKIKSHDIVYFQHTKQKGLIASTLAQQRYYLKEIKLSSEETVSYECFWELIPTVGNEIGPEKCNRFWARNIVTGQILTYLGLNVQIKSKEEVKEGGFNSEGLVNLICGLEGEGQNQQELLLQRGQRFNEVQNVIPVIKYFDSNVQKMDFKAVKALTGDSFIIVRVSEQTILDVSYILSSQQAFVKIVQILSTELKKMKVNNSTWKDMFMSLNEDLLQSFISVLKLLTGKIYDTDFDTIQSSGSSPIRQIQKILVETGIAQLVIQIIFTLYEPFIQILSNNDITDDKSIRMKVAQIFKLSYILVQKIVKDFQDNKIYFSRWIQLFLQHSNQINEQFIQQTLISILQNNPVSIKEMIKPPTIDKLIDSFIKEVTSSSEGYMPTKHLRLFSTFIRGENVIFKENQKHILTNFFFTKDQNNEQINYTFKFKVEYRISQVQEVTDDITSKEHNKVVKITLGTSDPCTIPEFYANFPNKFNYLLSYINLLADVCMDRNNEAIEYVETHLPLAVVSSVLFDPEIATLNKELKEQNMKGETKKYQISNIHEPFIRIAHHAYVNNFKFSPIQRIRKIVKWYKYEEGEVSEVEEITKTKRVYEGQKEEEQKTYLKYLLAYIKKFLQTCDREISNLQILYTVLSFLKETILLGLWESINQFKAIIPLLIKNIIKIEAKGFFEDFGETEKKRYQGKEWVDINKDKLKMNRPEIALAIQCKIKATEIFKYINEMENDIRLRYMMSFFQGIYEATENVQNYSQPIEDEVNQQALAEIGSEEQEQVIARNQTARQQFYKIFGTNILGEVKKYSQDEDMLMKNYLWYNKIRTMIPLQYDQLIQDPDKDRDLFKYAQEDFPPPKIVLSLFQLSGYYNKNLLNSSLNMLRGMFEQRSDIIQSYRNLLICGKGNLSEVYSNLKFMRNKFAMLKNDIIIKYDGNANKSFAYAIFKPYDHLGREQDKRSGIIQDLFFLARTLKDNVSLKNIESLMYVDKEVFNKQIVYQFYNQREKNNYLFQQLNMAEGIYGPLIQYIKIIGEEQNIPEIHRLLLFSIYQYLTLLCFNNMKAKHMFMKYIPDVLPHLTKRVGAASFLYQVCINNKILVNNEELVNLIFQKALGSCSYLQRQELLHGMVSNSLKQDHVLSNGFEKSRIMYSLRSLLLFNDQGHKKNQQMLLNKLSDNRFRTLTYAGRTVFTSKREDFNLSPQVTYITTRFELFSVLVQSQNLINIGKLQNMHSYEYLLECLSDTTRWQLRRALRSYLNRLYYVHQDNNSFMFEKFIAFEFKIINAELMQLIDLHRSKMLTEDLKVKNGIRFCYAQSQIILLIIEILITLHEVLLKPKFIAILMRQLAKQERYDQFKKVLHMSLIKLLKNLGCIDKLYSNTKTIVSFIKEIVELMRRNIFINFPVRFLQKMAEPTDKSQKQSEQKAGDGTPRPQAKKGIVFDRSKSFFRNLVDMIRFQKQQEKTVKLKQAFLKNKNQMDATESDLKNRYVETIFSVPEETLRPINTIKIKEQQDEHYQQHLQTANSKMFKLLAKPEFQENQQNLQLNNRLNSVKELLTDSPVLKKLKQDEFYKLIGIFTNMDSISAQIYKQNWILVNQQDPKPVFSKREIITNCFQLIINYPDMIRDEQKIFIIKLVRCYIAEAVEEKQNHKLSVDKWSAEYYSDQSSGEDPESQKRSELVKRQHQIQKCGGSRLLLSIFKENLYSKPELLNEALLLGIIYLYNGNTYCQNSILAELVADRSNSAFISIKNLVRNIGNFLIEVRKFKQNEKKRDFSYKIVDSYDHFDKKQNILVKMFGHKTDKFQIQTELDYQLALCRTFRFLQLFCENNNIEMKKFIMTQTNEDNQPKITSINFISEATQLLRQFFKIMSIKIVNIPPSILDFINQITQIPCVWCQKTFMSSTFFEDMSYMAGFFEQKLNIEQRKFNYFLEGDKNGEEQSEDDPLFILQQIYQKGIGLALSNFEGNDDEIFAQFLNKCQPRYLWIVIRQNMIRLLRPKAHLYGVSRQQIEKALEQEYMNSTVKGKKEDYMQYREYHIEKTFVQQIFNRFNDREIAKFVVEQRAKGKEFGPEICNIIDVLIILKKIDDYADRKKKAATANIEAPNQAESEKAVKAKNFREEMYTVAIQNKEYKNIKTFVETFQDLILSIEVSSHNGQVVSFQNVYFPRHPVFSYLAADTRDAIMFEVSRATRRDKLIQLQDRFQQIQEQIKWNYELKYYKNSFLSIPYSLSITSEYIQQIRKAARLISYLICFLMLLLIVVEHDTKTKQSYFIFFHYNEKLIMRAICLIQLILTLLFSALWIKMRLKLCLNKLQKQSQGEGEGESAEAEPAQEEAVEEGEGQPPAEPAQPAPTDFLTKLIFYAVFISNYFFKVLGSIGNGGKRLKKLLYDDLMSLFGFRHISLVFHFFLDPIFNFIKSIYVGFSALLQFQPGFLSILIFVVASIMGNFFGVEWYVIHLFDYFVGIPLLTNVFKAVINNIGQLSLLSTFAACFILVFNIISLNTYTVVIYQDDIPAQSCVNIVGCVLQVYTSGAIGDDMDQIYPGRFTYDTIYNIFMEIIFSNMISGIMIDSFGSLKEADAERDADKKNHCYICSMEKPEMEKQGTTFKKHTEKHFLWNYIFYRYVIKLKDPCDYTGLEYSISTQLAELKIDWFPDNGPRDEGGAIEELMGEIKSKMEKITEDIGSFMTTQTSEVVSSKSSIKAIIDQRNKKPALSGIQANMLQQIA